MSLTTPRFEYRVVELREKLLRGSAPTEKLQQILSEHARVGWQLKTITSVDVAGRVTGAVSGLLVTFERPVA